MINNKTSLLEILDQAKEDYEASILASESFISRRSTYRKLKTRAGLCQYFEQASNTCNIVHKHLSPFKPIGVTKDKWFPVGTREGLVKRLEVIEKAIAFYISQDESDVPLVLRSGYMENVHLYIAYENGARPSDDGYTEAVYN
jgi:hypothetical protein